MNYVSQITTYLSSLKDKIAIIDKSGSFSFADLDNTSSVLALYFQSLNLKNSRIITHLPNSFELVALYIACLKSQNVLVPTVYSDAPDELKHVFQETKPSLLFIHKDKIDILKQIDVHSTTVQKVIGIKYEEPNELVQSFSSITSNNLPEKKIDLSLDKSQPIFLLYTSGSTGLPKGVIYNHNNTNGMIQNMFDSFPNCFSADVPLVVYDQVSHIDGLVVLLPQLAAGGTCVLEECFDVDVFLKNLMKYKPYLLTAHLAHLHELVLSPTLNAKTLESVKRVFTGGDTLSTKLQKQFINKTGHFISVAYGLTESLPLLVTNKPYLSKEGVLGKPVNESVKIKLVDKNGSDVSIGKTGEIFVQSPSTTPGYWQHKDTTDKAFQDKWFKTGDLAYEDSDGVFWFVGRSKEIIERGSENITPEEIEYALLQNPAIDQAGVVGQKSQEEGEVPVAFIVLKKNQKLTEQECIEFLKSKLSEYKIPVKFYFTDHLTMTKSNKIDRKGLQKRLNSQ